MTNNKNIIIIGISGASASGKSLLANTIVNELGTALSVCRCRLALFPEDPLPDKIPITHEFIAACCAHRYPLPPTINSKNNPAMDAVLSSTSPMAVYDTSADPRLGHLLEKYEASQIKSLMSHAIRLDCAFHFAPDVRKLFNQGQRLPSAGGETGVKWFGDDSGWRYLHAISRAKA